MNNYMILSKAYMLFVVLFSITLSSPSYAQAQKIAEGDLSIVIFGINDIKGDMIITYYNDPISYYEEDNISFRVDTIALNESKDNLKSLVLPVTLPEGKYVIYVHHDRNSDGKISKSLMGIPEEGVGFVNGKAIKKPKFTKAAVEVVTGEIRVCNVTLNYYESPFK